VPGLDHQVVGGRAYVGEDYLGYVDLEEPGIMVTSPPVN
jgi:hypothetical protein